MKGEKAKPSEACNKRKANMKKEERTEEVKEGEKKVEKKGPGE